MIHYKISFRFVILLLLLIPTTGRTFAQINYTIVVKDMVSRQPLSGATLLSLNSRFRQTSDSLGRITIPLPVYNRSEKLQISIVGYKTAIINATVLVTQQYIDLDRDIGTLQEVVVTNNYAAQRVRSIQMGAEVISSAEAKRLPAILGEVDIIKVLQLKPGVKSAGEGLAGFYVRGGGADQNLILIDNAPVYNPNHLLGLFSVFNNDAVNEVKLYKAAYPASYSGRLSSVLDVSMRAGSLDTLSFTGGIGLLSSRLSVEAPIKKGRSSVIISGRRTYFDIFTNAINRVKKNDPEFQIIPQYFFSDLNLRSDWKLNNNNLIWATAYWGSDNFSAPSEESTGKFTWGNRTASINWRTILPGNSDITSTIFNSDYRYQLSYQFGFNELVFRSGINSTGIKVIARTSAARAVKWQAGFDGMIHRLSIGDFKASSDLSGFTSGEKIAGNEGGVFINSEWDQGKRLALLGGVRLSGFNAGSHWSFNAEPRFGAKIKINEHSAVKASYTRMYQYLHQASLSSASLPTDIWYPSTKTTRPQYADQASIGWSQALKDNMFYLSGEAYYKWMNNQVEFRDGANVFGNPRLENEFVFGKANAYGVEAYLEKKLGRTTGWFGYTLSWTTRTFEDINNGIPFKPRYDRRHDFSFVFIHKLNNKFTLSGNWIFGTGTYITVPVGRYIFQDEIGERARTITPVYNKRSNYQLAPVHRLDLSLVMALRSRRGTQDISFSLYNAYSRRNPFYIQFKEVDNADGQVSVIEPTLVSLFPVLPGITYNFKF